MRTIKFRGKSLGNHEWVYGDLTQQPTSPPRIRTLEKVDENGIASAAYAEVDPDTVGQYIGQRDKRGRQVYEGDIIRDVEDLTFEIWWVSGYGAFMYRPCRGEGYILSLDPGLEFTVVGNVHDNPEMLNADTAYYDERNARI